jgi:molybdate transport system substrate-binding protein
MPPPLRTRLAAALLAVAVVLAGLLFGCRAAEKPDVQVAVATNFEGPMRQIAAEFAKETGYRAAIASGATGALLTQIEQGAPFDVLLAADTKAPAQLETEGLAVPGTRFVYALGTLVLWSARPGYVDGAGAVLRNGDFQHLAIANPRLAPYGAAAEQALTSLKLLDVLRPRIVEGESIGQTYQYVASGNAELGFVALSQVEGQDTPRTGSSWVVPANLYEPIEQQAALLKRGAGNAAAHALLEYLRRQKVRDRIRASGYGLP